MNITKDEVKHLAKLSNISLDESEVENLRGDLENIVNYIKQLDELDTENVEPTYSVSENQNIWREDEIDNYGVGKEELLALAGENIEAGQVKVPKVL
ncbi:MAG: Asp-tRNA(Asn)/Glu-tRNA(Gln) amidotransferase subunit GatC [Candidatus Nanogingivalis sp.]|jgi:aspartyl-tRNA(Asn)/glutamyl-tRNA(Gln) amidotransferase subunit C